MSEDRAYLTVDDKGRATLPEEVREDLGVKAGDLLMLERTGHGTYEIVPAALVPRDQLWFHHPDVRRRVEEAEVEFREGRAEATRTPRQVRALLDRLKKRGR